MRGHPSHELRRVAAHLQLADRVARVTVLEIRMTLVVEVV